MRAAASSTVVSSSLCDCRSPAAAAPDRDSRCPPCSRRRNRELSIFSRFNCTASSCFLHRRRGLRSPLAAVVVGCEAAYRSRSRRRPNPSAPPSLSSPLLALHRAIQSLSSPLRRITAIQTAEPMSISALNSYLPKPCPPPRPCSRPPRATSTKLFSQPPTLATLSDPHVLRLAETLEDSIASSSSSPPPPLQKLRDISSQSLLTTPWPSRKDEPFRFTDTSFIRNSQIHPVTLAPTQNLDALSGFADSISPNIAIIDGYLVESLSNLSELPDGVFVGRLSDLNSKGLMEKVSKYVSNFQGDLFWSLNGVGAPDVVLVYVPEGCKVEKPLHLRFFSMNRSYKGSKSLPISNPRVLVLVEKGGDIGIVEEYVGGDGDDRCYWTNSVMEVVVSDGAKVCHSYIQTQSLGAAHVKWTSVCQGAAVVAPATLGQTIFMGRDWGGLGRLKRKRGDGGASAVSCLEFRRI
ncbi:hypothetical protein SASPL_131011 [Salvia splendens]|uniref:Fe-S cluster assembly protein SufD n=1 Tax=Salvia splendens TaxID=180675 RepID=A0A8X8X8G1_SALSN|nr:hypothetical protein SASPL_131011 [Salvia splendens]